MDVFDSNVWIYGLTHTCDEAVALVDEVIDTRRNVRVSAYIFEEVMQNIQRSNHDREVIDRALNDFAQMVHGSPAIHNPTQQEVREMDLAVHREGPRIAAMAMMLGIQEKDVPIVVCAIQCAQQRPDSTIVIHTADRPFSRLDPSDHFERIVMRYVDCP